MTIADGRFPQALRETGLPSSGFSRQAGEEAAPPELDPSARGIRILLVDDHAMNRKVVRMFLRPFDLEIVEACDGAEALMRLEEQTFDLVLMDVHMPTMGGCEAVAAIRASGAPWAGMPVIALTADALPSDQQRYLAAGMDGYVAKPMAQRELFSAISLALRLRADIQAG
jgi:CheY-like chemotaxis protein